MNENVLTFSQIVSIKKCGRFLAQTMDIVKKAVKVGITTKELDDIAENELKKRDCKPAFLNYYVPGNGHYPASLCVSINEEIVHGLPDITRKIQQGDVVSLDLGAEYDGIYTDMATTVIAGTADAGKSRLLDITSKSLEIGIKQAVEGNHIGDIGHAIEEYTLENDFEVIKEYVGHGIGTAPHMWPQIPNFGKKGSGPKILEGMALAIEPMTTSGNAETKLHSDKWTVKTANGAIAAHFEHTIIIENSQPVIVTLP